MNRHCCRCGADYDGVRCERCKVKHVCKECGKEVDLLDWKCDCTESVVYMKELKPFTDDDLVAWVRGRGAIAANRLGDDVIFDLTNRLEARNKEIAELKAALEEAQPLVHKAKTSLSALGSEMVVPRAWWTELRAWFLAAQIDPRNDYESGYNASSMEGFYKMQEIEARK